MMLKIMHTEKYVEVKFKIIKSVVMVVKNMYQIVIFKKYWHVL